MSHQPMIGERYGWVVGTHVRCVHIQNIDAQIYINSTECVSWQSKTTMPIIVLST